jgi:uncharacterized membrane protein
MKSKKTLFFLSISVLLLITFISSCSKGGDTTTTNPTNPGTGGTGGTNECATLTTGQAGPLYTAVKSLLSANCSSCHTGANSTGGKDLTTDCNIILSKDRIKARAVDGSPSFMPQGSQLSAGDKKKITDWVNAGGRFSD